MRLLGVVAAFHGLCIRMAGNVVLDADGYLNHHHHGHLGEENGEVDGKDDDVRVCDVGQVSSSRCGGVAVRARRWGCVLRMGDDRC